MLDSVKYRIGKYLGLPALNYYWALVRSPWLFRSYMYAYAAAGGTHTYTYAQPACQLKQVHRSWWVEGILFAFYSEIKIWLYQYFD
jgi:hypothetical protein